MDDYEPEGMVHTVYAAELRSQLTRKAPQCNIHVNQQPVKALIDTGVSINLMTQGIFGTTPCQPKIRPTYIQVYAFRTKTPLPLTGMFMADITHEQKSARVKVYVTTADSGMLLSCKTAEELQLSQFAFSIHRTNIETMLESFPGLFEGIGCLKGKEVHLHVDQSVQPVAQESHLPPEAESRGRAQEA